MPISDADWDAVKSRLERLYCGVELDCDGYRLTLRLERVDTFRNAIVVYVGGEYRGEWILKDCEQRRRFLRPVRCSAYPPKVRATLKKMSKRARAILNMDPDKKITGYFFTWTSFSALRRHLERNNNEITLIDTRIRARETEVTA